MSPPILHLRDIHITFGGTPLLTGAELAVEEGARICLVGRNGSGKSTLLKVAAGLLDPDGGEGFRQPRTTIAFLPQEPDFSGYATAYDYVAAGFAEGHDPHPGRVILEALGLTGEEDPATFSGGEARRCALARVLGPEPDILLLDEHTAALDPKSAAKIAELTSKIVRENRLTTLMVTHSMHQAAEMPDRIVMMHHGKIAEDFSGINKQRVRIPDLMDAFDRVTKREYLDESAAAMLKQQYI